MIDSNKIDSLIGAKVIDPQEHKIGTVGQIYLESATNQPSWVTIKTGLFGTSESFAPLDRAEWDGSELHLAFEKSRVKDAPRIENDGSLDEADEEALYTYYGISAPAGNRTAATPNTASNAGTPNTASNAGTPNTATPNAGTPNAANRTAEQPTTAGQAGTAQNRGTQGYDTSGPTTDDAMTRSEEQLRVGTEKVSTGHARLRKHVVTENQTVTVPVSHEEVRLEREPITDANVGKATGGPELSDEEHEVQLTEERVVVEKETVPVERVRLGTETVTEEERVTEEVRKEKIDYDETDIDTERRGTDDTH